MTQQFADMTWESRWNGAEAVAALSQSGPEVQAVNFMGVIRFRLDTDDVGAIVRAARAFADMAEEVKKQFDDERDLQELIEQRRRGVNGS
jgi:hypothetical protein